MRILGYRTANGEAVTVADTDWLQHVYAIGGTGAGKTTWLESLMAEDLAARRGFCYVDKHGDSAKRIADSSPQPPSTGSRPTSHMSSASIPFTTCLPTSDGR